MRLIGLLLELVVIGVGFGLLICNFVEKPTDSVERE